LSELSQEISQRIPLEIRCRIAPEVDQVSPAIAEALWRVIQEALMNVEKHAAAQYVQIDLDMSSTAIILRVTDDGIGLPAGLTNRPGHYGLQGMRERMEGLGGVLTVGGNGRAGTVIEASLPLIGSQEYPKKD
jgi:signal transduction histidine kinase